MLSGERVRFDATRLYGTADEVEAQWLDVRRRGIGGSDAAAVLGVSPWRTPLEVWLDKTGRVGPDDLSGVEAVAMGVELEPVVRRMYRDRHPEATVRRVNAVLRSRAWDFAQASLDGVTSDPALGVGVLEIKTGGSMDGWEDGRVPEHYLCQVTHYLAVTGYAFADVAALVGDHGLHYVERRVVRDDADISDVMAVERTFWQDYVLADVMPVVEGTDGESRALAAWHAEPDSTLLDATGDPSVEAAIAEYEDARAAVGEAESRRRLAANRLRAAIGGHRGLTTDTSRVTWVRGTSTRLDARALRAEMPDVYERYCRACTRDGGLRISDL